MGVDFAEPANRSSVEKQVEDQSTRERWNGDVEKVDSDEALQTGKHSGKSKSTGRKDRSRDRRKEDREKDADRDKLREKERDKERRDHKEREREREKEVEKDADRGRDTERIKEKNRDKDREKEKEKEKDRAKDKEREKYTDRDRDRERGYGRHRGKETSEREKEKDRDREREKLADQDKDRASERDKSSRKQKEDSYHASKDGRSRSDNDYTHNQASKQQVDKSGEKSGSKDHAEKADNHESTSQLEQRIAKMKEQRLMKSSEGAPEILSWVNKSRKIEEKRNVEKEKAMQFSKKFEEQDNMNDEGSDDEPAAQDSTQHLSGVKVLHGIDKVLEGGAVVLTLKDQSILADGDINEEVDMLENVEIGEQKRRNDAYKASKKKVGVYDDKFNDEFGVEKKMLPQYDDPVADEGLTLDSSGLFSGEAERKLEELRRRIQGGSTSNQGEDLNSIGKTSTDYYTQEEMTKFKKPKKKKSLRKKEKLDLNALEAEAKAAGLGVEDLGSRDGRRQVIREEQDRIEAETRSNAFQSALAKADEASKALRQAQVRTMETEEEDAPAFGDDDEELRKSLERARRIALQKQGKDEKSGPMVIKLLASSKANEAASQNPNASSGGDQPESKVVFTEMEEFVWGLQLDEEEKKPETEDVFMEEDEVPSTPDQEMRDEDVGTDVQEAIPHDTNAQENEKEVAPDQAIHEPAVGKGLASALKLLKDRGTLKETVEWGGRNMDKKKSKLVGIVGDGATKEIRIERTDEYGRILTPKEAFRILSHKFHGKGPGKMKQEKRMRQYQEELKIKQMKNADTPSLSVERMREAQAKMKAPYLVLSGNVKHGQSSDSSSGFATVERDFAGGLTPMLGDKKVEHFLNIKRKAENGDQSSQKKPRT